MSDIHIYFICHTYDTFQKDSIEATIGKEITTEVFTRANPLIDYVAHTIPSRFGKYSSHNKVNLTNTPNNCHIFITPVSYCPVNYDYLRMGERHFKSVLNTIKQNQILPPTLVHTHFLWSSGYVGMRLKQEYEIPFIATGHGYDVYDLPFRSNAWKKRICSVLNAADHVITVSNSNLACLQKLNIESPISVIPNGFDEKLFYPRNKDECRKILGLPHDKKILLTVGNCVAIKGHKYLIEAMKTVHSLHPNVLCVIVGSGDFYPKEQKLIRQLGLSDCVWMVGGKPHEKIPLWMNACDVFVLPSLGESFGVVNIEALACGKPVVGTKVGGVPEIICSEDYGLLYDAGDVIGLCRVLEEALEREWDLNKILEYAGRYKWSEICKEIVDVYSNYT